MKLFLTGIFIIFFLTFDLRAQTIIEPSPVKWYSINDVDSLLKIQKRPLIIDVYTDWCGWCKYMMKTTFASEGIAGYINNNFYAIRFDAESTDTVVFRGKKYGSSNGKNNDLAVELLDNRLAYPTIVYFDRNGKKYRRPGYVKPKNIEPILIYFAENVNQSCDLDEFIVNYMYAFGDIYKEELEKNTGKLDTTGTLKWVDFEQAAQLSKKNNKLMLVYIYVDWCFSCKALEKAVFRDSELDSLINNYFYPVKFNAASQDTIKAFGKEFYPTGKGNPHQLAYALLNRNFRFPTLMFIDNKNNVLSVNQVFLPARVLKPYIKYMGEGKYKTMSYEQYLKKNGYEQK